MDEEERVIVAILLVIISLFMGVIVYAWMMSAGLPKIIAAPIGVISFLTVLAAFFGIIDVVIAAIKAISKLFE